jgi:hypothetical protein
VTQKNLLVTHPSVSSRQKFKAESLLRYKRKYETSHERHGLPALHSLPLCAPLPDITDFRRQTSLSCCSKQATLGREQTSLLQSPAFALSPPPSIFHGDVFFLPMTHLFSPFKLPSRDALGLALTEGSVCKRVSERSRLSRASDFDKREGRFRKKPLNISSQNQTRATNSLHTNQIMRCTIDRISNIVCTNPLPQRSE